MANVFAGIIGIHEAYHMYQYDHTRVDEYKALKVDEANLAEIGPNFAMLDANDKVFRKVMGISLDEPISYLYDDILHGNGFNIFIKKEIKGFDAHKFLTHLRKIRENLGGETVAWERVFLSDEAEEVRNFLINLDLGED